MTDVVDVNAPPICPKCGKPVFRSGWAAQFQDANAALKGVYTVCMHCSTIWQLLGTVAELRFEEMPFEKAPALLADMARQFAEHRAMAEILGMPYGEFAEQLARLNRAVRERRGPAH